MNLDRAIDLGAVLGVRIRVHVAFLLLLAILLGQTLVQLGHEGVLWFGTRILLLFGSFLVHELGHALAARAYGVRVFDIVLGPLGGMARLERLPSSPRVELVIASAGPLANLLVLLLLVPLQLASGRGLVPDGSVVQWSVVEFSLVVNAAMAGLNLIPAFPMDGGRVLRATMTGRIGYEAATARSALVGRILAVIAMGSALFDPRYVAVALLGAFVWYAGSRELRAARAREESALGEGRSDGARRFLALEGSADEQREQARQLTTRLAQRDGAGDVGA